MKYGSIYLVVRDFDKSLDFYEEILEMKVSATNGKKLPPIRYLNVFHHIGILLLWIRMEIQLKLQEHMRNKYYQYIEKAHMDRRKQHEKAI